MSDELTAFLDDVVPRMRAADTLLHDGEPDERIAMWSHKPPVTLFGAAFTAVGWEDVRAAFHALGRRFSGCTSFEMDLLAADVSGDLGYIVAIERTTAVIDGHGAVSYALRVSTIFRREGDRWHVVHRHGDPYDASAGDIAAKLGAPAPK